MTTRISSGTFHTVPADLKAVLTSDEKVRTTWESLTPLARNEWICWTISPKRAETRDDHVKRVKADLAAGKRRPCCWIGCVHRTDKPVSKSVQWILDKQRGH